MPDREEKRWQHYRAAKAMRRVRKQVKRNRKPKRVRRKDWKSYSFDDLDALDELDFPQSERMMPRGERERRRANLALAELEEGDEDTFEELSPVEETEGQRGIVVEVSSGLCRVDLGRRSLVCSVRRSLSAEESGYTNVVAVGDEVIVLDSGSGQGVVEAVLPRRSVPVRPDVF